MLKILKLFYWSLHTVSGRYQLLQYLCKDIPGFYGRELRARYYKKYFSSAGEGIVIHPDVRIRNIHLINLNDRARIGESVMIQAGGGVDLGKDVLIGPGVKIWSANHGFSDLNTPIQDQEYEVKKVVIGDGCWIGANAFIMPGVELGKGCIVSACAVVSGKKYPDYKILSGNPARVIGDRTST